MRLGRLRARWRRFAESDTGAVFLRGLRYLFVAGVLLFLGYQFTRIGWRRVGAALPTTPWFYVFLLMGYLTLPAVESVLYGRIWNTGFWSALPVFFRKRVLNNDVVGYSGEVYLYWWARKYEDLDDLYVLRTIKDNTIVSALTSTTLSIAVLAALFLAGQVAILEPYVPTDSLTLWAVGLGVVAAIGLGVWMRGVIFSLSLRLLAFFALLHAVRFVLINGFQVLQWEVVLPEVSMEAWFTLVGLYIVIHQIPVLPSRDLVFVGAGVELSSWLGLSPAVVGGMLLVKSVIDKGLNALIFALGGWLAPDPDVEEGEEKETLDPKEMRALMGEDVSEPAEPDS